MPRRTIVIGRQPSAFQFQDDFGPLNNGLAYAAGQWLASGRDRAQIEMQRDAHDAEQQERQQTRAQDVDFRNQDLELRRLALDQGQQNRQDELSIRREDLDRVKARDASEANAKLRDDMGAVGKYALDWIRGGNPTGAPKDGASDLGRDKFYWDRAVQEIGNPDHDLEVVETMDLMGNPVKREVKRPLSPEQRAARVRLINRRFDELRGVAVPTDAPAPAPVASPAEEHHAVIPYTPEMQAEYEDWRGNQPAPSLSSMALGTPAPAAPPTAATGAGQEQARQQFMAGAGGMGILAPSFMQLGAPTPTAPQAPAPQADPRAVFVEQTGINPDPSTGITVDDFVGPDDQRRVAALRTLPPQERLKAIATLRAMGFN